MHPTAARARLRELQAELRTKAHDGTLTHKRMDDIEAEGEQLEVVLKTYRAGTALASYAEPRPYGHGPDAPADVPRWQLPEGEGSRLAQRKWHAPSPLDMSGEQVASLFAAGRNRMTYSTRVGDDGIHNKTLDGGDIHFKAPAAVAEGAPGSLIPPILLPQAFTLRLEPTRIIEYLVNGVPPTGQSVSWLQHSGNTAPPPRSPSWPRNRISAPRSWPKKPASPWSQEWRLYPGRCSTTSPPPAHSSPRNFINRW